MPSRSVISVCLADRRTLLCEMIDTLLRSGVHVTESVSAFCRDLIVAAMRRVLEGGRPALAKVQQRVHLQEQHRIRFLSQKSPVVYIVFDLLYVRGRSIMSDSLANRRAMLCEMIDPLLLPGVHVRRGERPCIWPRSLRRGNANRAGRRHGKKSGRPIPEWKAVTGVAQD